MLDILNSTYNIIAGMGVAASAVKPVTTIVMLAITTLFFILLNFVCKHVIEPFIYRITRNSDIKWDDIVFRHKAMRWAWAVILSLVAYEAFPAAAAYYPAISNALAIAARVTLILSFMMLIIESVKSLFLLIGDREKINDIVDEMHQAFDNDQEYVYTPSHSLKGLQQMLTILIVGFAIVLIISILIGRDPLIVFSGLGAMAAVLMLVFQDSILGVVAGVQITANDLLQPGDWICVPKYGANGIVKEVTLAAVKVQNFDKTIITIPPYKLITEGFQNWRGMWINKGRRIARSINIDLSTIRFATKDEISKWREAKWWGKEYDDKNRISNVTALRMYLEHYITEVPTFQPNMLYMIRELQPTADGLPIEIYFFTSQTEWKRYERVQADVIDSVLAMLPEFGLRAYQHPSGHYSTTGC